MAVIVRADYENNAELFWDTIREKHPAIAEKLQADTDIVLTNEEWETVQSVEGFEGGPSYAPTALVEVQTKVETMYNCKCGELEGVIGAVSPEKAAELFVINRAKSHAWFANQNPYAVSVEVDGTEYLPAAFAPANAKYVWGA
jgi:hypothetical protein